MSKDKIKTNLISVVKSARYFTLGEINKNVKEIIFVLHGYGQLASNFISKFASVNNDNRIIIAPEALNKFYLKGFYGNVGATWMTKEDRETEITDYVNYLDSVAGLYEELIDKSDIKLKLLGFSQGCATACRWFELTKYNFNELILWGSSIPPDIDFIRFKSKMSSSLKLVVGDKDEFISGDRLETELEYLEAKGIDYELIKYSGKHDILPEYLSESKLF